MEIPLGAQVKCIDGICGHSLYVLINPVTDRVVHIVVEMDSSLNSEFIVPVDYVTDTKSDTIQLRCTEAELGKMDPFIKTTYVEEKMPERILGYEGGMYAQGQYYYLPYVTPDTTVEIPVEHLEIPAGELALTRGTRVEATDGYVGKVDELVVNPQNDHITHLVMREGHLWGKKDVIIPLSEMGDTREDTVFLKLNKKQVESLPTFELKRLWS